MKINHTYKIDFKPINNFKYTMYDEHIGVCSYERYIESQIPYIIKTLNKNNKSRQAILTVNTPTHMSCLISIQFQIYNSNLYVTVNLRSQAVEYVIKDTDLINYIITSIIPELDMKINNIDITVNVGNYHSVYENKN